MPRRFPISELRTVVARALHSTNYAPAESGRVRAVPDTRTIRYYTTLGLIDPPAEMQGRTAFYGERHVLQLVAIKRLQAENQTLSDIQQRLLGITPQQLKKLANLPSDFWDSVDQYLARLQKTSAQPRPANPTPPLLSDSRESRDFWAETAALPGNETASTDVAPSQHQIPVQYPRPFVKRCTSLALYPGVQLIVEANSRPASGSQPIDTALLQAAAVPLLNELVRQGFFLVANDDSSLTPKASP